MTFNPQNRPGSFGKGDLASQAADAIVDERVDTLESGGGGGLSTVQFSISWSGGDGDFKLTSGFASQDFLLSTVFSGIKGIIMATDVNVTEAFVGIGTSVGLILGSDSVTPLAEWYNQDPATLLPEQGSLSSLIETGAAVGTAAMSIPARTCINLAPAPFAQVTSDGGTGPALNLASAGKAIVTVHYIPLPTATL
jgi:hypothetical protein